MPSTVSLALSSLGGGVEGAGDRSVVTLVVGVGVWDNCKLASSVAVAARVGVGVRDREALEVALGLAELVGRGAVVAPLGGAVVPAPPAGRVGAGIARQLVLCG